MTRPAVFLLVEDPDDLCWMDEMRRNLAKHLSRGADGHRAAGRTELADTLDAAALRFDPHLSN